MRRTFAHYRAALAVLRVYARDEGIVEEHEYDGYRFGSLTVVVPPEEARKVGRSLLELALTLNASFRVDANFAGKRIFRVTVGVKLSDIPRAVQEVAA